MQHDQRHRYAVKAGRFNGRNVYRVPVQILNNDSRQCKTVREAWVVVLAPSAAEAANWVQLNEPGADLPETEIRAYGPRGGRVNRFTGWESAVAREIMRPHPERDQLRLF